MTQAYIVRWTHIVRGVSGVESYPCETQPLSEAVALRKCKELMADPQAMDVVCTVADWRLERRLDLEAERVRRRSQHFRAEPAVGGSAI